MVWRTHGAPAARPPEAWKATSWAVSLAAATRTAADPAAIAGWRLTLLLLALLRALQLPRPTEAALLARLAKVAMAELVEALALLLPRRGPVQLRALVQAVLQRATPQQLPRGRRAWLPASSWELVPGMQMSQQRPALAGHCWLRPAACLRRPRLQPRPQRCLQQRPRRPPRRALCQMRPSLPTTSACVAAERVVKVDHTRCSEERGRGSPRAIHRS